MKDDKIATSEEGTDSPDPTAEGPKGKDEPIASIPFTPAVKSKIENRVKWACIWSLVALGLIVWALVHPKPLPVIVAMSVGQLIGTLSLLLFLGSVALDLRSHYRLSRRKEDPSGAE